jgi:ABC-type sugar transport system substrate-binding protein
MIEMKGNALMHKHSSRSRWGMVAVLSAVTVIAAACSSSSGSSKAGSSSPAAATNSVTSSGASATDKCVANAKAAVDPLTQPPTTLGPKFTALNAPAPTGKSITYVYTGNNPNILLEANGIQDAAKALGWKYKGVSYDGTASQLASDLTQEITAKPDMLVVTGVSPGTIKNQLDAAKAAGVLVADTSIDSENEPPTSYPGYVATSSSSGNQRNSTKLIAQWIEADSGCKANVAIFNLTNLAVLAQGTDTETKTLQADCPDCKVSNTLIPLADIGTPRMTGAIISKLQSSPDVNYVIGSFGAVIAGLPTALKQAGISGVKLVTQSPTNQTLADLRSGDVAMAVSLPSYLTGWFAVDSLLHAMQDKKPTDEEAAPAFVLVTPTDLPQLVPTGDTLPTWPTDYAAEFKKLWKVS